MAESRADVSVVLTTYNRIGLVEQALSSVLDQERPPDEVIVVDDGSDDGTPYRLSRFGKNIFYVYTRNRGISAARNIGVRLSRGKTIAFLDSDDLWLRPKLRRQMEILDAQPDLGYCHTDEYWIRNGRPVNPMKKHQKHSGDMYMRSLSMCVISPSSVVIRRRVLEETGLFDETFPAGEDYDLWLRMTSRFDGAYVNEKCIVKRGGHEGQLSAQPCIDRYRILALEKMLADDQLNPMRRDATREELTRRARLYIQGCAKHGRHEDVDRFKKVLRSVEHG